MKTFSGITLSPKDTILHFSHKNVGMLSHTLYFFHNNSLQHGHENYRRLIFVVIDLDPEKIERKGGASFLAFSIFTDVFVPILSWTICKNWHIAYFLHIRVSGLSLFTRFKGSIQR